MYKIYLIIFTAFLFTSCIQEKENFNGKWYNETLEQTKQGGFLKREVIISGTEITISINVFADSEFKSPIYYYRTEGHIESEEVADNNLHKIILDEQYFKLLTENPTFISSYGFHYCQVKKDEEINISENGCAFIQSIKRLNQAPPEIQIRDSKLLIANNTPLSKI